MTSDKNNQPAQGMTDIEKKAFANLVEDDIRIGLAVPERPYLLMNSGADKAKIVLEKLLNYGSGHISVYTGKLDSLVWSPEILNQYSERHPDADISIIFDNYCLDKQTRAAFSQNDLLKFYERHKQPQYKCSHFVQIGDRILRCEKNADDFSANIWINPEECLRDSYKKAFSWMREHSDKKSLL